MVRLLPFLFLLQLLLATGCAAFKYGLTEEQAFGRYMKVSEEQNSFGYKRLKYNLLKRGKNSLMWRFISQKGRPQYIYEYQDSLKRDGIIFYYPEIDSAFVFKEQGANGITSKLICARAMFEVEEQKFRNFWSRPLNKKLPTKRYSHYNVNYSVSTDQDSVTIQLTNPLSCPLQFNLATTDNRRLNTLFKSLNPFIVEPLKNRVIRYPYNGTGKVTIDVTTQYGDPYQKVDNTELSLPLPAEQKIRIIEEPEDNHRINEHGIRFALDHQDTVYAAKSGYVVGVVESYKQSGNSIKWQDFTNSIIVYHPESGLYTKYEHLRYQGSLVKVGDRVDAGSPIGLAGKTGYASDIQLKLLSLVPDKDGLQPVKMQFKEGYKGDKLDKGDTVINQTLSSKKVVNSPGSQSKTIYIEEFQWTLTIPEEFEKMSKQEVAWRQNLSESVIEDSYDREVKSNANRLFAYKNGKYNYIESLYQTHPNVSLIDYDKLSQMVNNILYNSLKKQMTDAKFDTSFTETDVNGLTFKKFSIKVEPPMLKTMHFVRYSRLFGNRQFALNLMYIDEEKGQELIEAWQNSTFD